MAFMNHKANEKGWNIDMHAFQFAGLMVAAFVPVERQVPQPFERSFAHILSRVWGRNEHLHLPRNL